MLVKELKFGTPFPAFAQRFIGIHSAVRKYSQPYLRTLRSYPRDTHPYVYEVGNLFLWEMLIKMVS